MKRYKVLDGLRGVFALIIVFYHMSNKYYVVDNFVVRHAQIFVDYFFVLSGFVMMHVYDNRIHDSSQIKKFVNKRLRRIYPLHLYTLIVFLFLEISKTVLYNYGFMKHPAFSNNNISNFISSIFLLNSTGIGIDGERVGWNYPSWSISAEFISYILFAVVIYYVNKTKRYFILYIIPLISLLFVFMVTDHLSVLSTGNLGFLRGIYGFFLGVLANKLLAKTNFFVKTPTFFLTILEILPLVLVFVFMYNWEYIKSYSYIYSILFAFSIYVFSLEKGVLSRLFNNRIFDKLGEWSYSIYLNHAAVIFIVEFFAFNILKIKNVYLVNTIPIIIVLIVIGYSKYTYRFIEQKFYKLN